MMNGVRRLLYEIIYNRCDNAIRYNVDGGSVEVQIADAPEQVTLTVAESAKDRRSEDQMGEQSKKNAGGNAPSKANPSAKGQ